MLPSTNSSNHPSTHHPFIYLSIHSSIYPSFIHPFIYASIHNSSVLAWRIPGTAEPGGLPSLGSHRVGHNWNALAAAANPSKHLNIHPSTQPLTIHSSIYPCIHSSIHSPSIQLCIHPQIHLTIHPCMHPPTHSLTIYSSMYPSIHPSIHSSSIHLHIHPQIHLTIHPPICPFALHPSPYPFTTHLSIHSPIDSPSHPPTDPSSIHLDIHLLIHPSIHPSIHLTSKHDIWEASPALGPQRHKGAVISRTPGSQSRLRLQEERAWRHRGRRWAWASRSLGCSNLSLQRNKGSQGLGWTASSSSTQPPAIGTKAPPSQAASWECGQHLTFSTKVLLQKGLPPRGAFKLTRGFSRTHWKRPWGWERLRTSEEEGNRGWDGWMASLIHRHEFEQTPGDSENSERYLLRGKISSVIWAVRMQSLWSKALWNE